MKCGANAVCSLNVTCGLFDGRRPSPSWNNGEHTNIVWCKGHGFIFCNIEDSSFRRWVEEGARAARLSRR